MKKCPFCAEEIQSEAIKCRYCGERLDMKATTGDSDEQQRNQDKLSGQEYSLPHEASKVESHQVSSPQQSTVVTPPKKKPHEKVITYAGFWKRLAAFFIDLIIIAFGIAFGCFVVGLGIGIIFGGGALDTATWEKMGSFFGVIIMWLYYALMESSPKQATLGKMALGIIVTDLKGNKIGFGKATGRYLGRIISSSILCIGFIMVAFTQKKQGLHDIMTGCLVVNSEAHGKESLANAKYLTIRAEQLANEHKQVLLAEERPRQEKGKIKERVSVQTFTSRVLGAKFVLIPAGSFMMGSPSSEQGRGNDETQHKVTISEHFYMQTTEVTQGQWKKVMGRNPAYFTNWLTETDYYPVEQVSWNDVQEFIRKFNEFDGMDKYRLPTEAQWEYAARAETTTMFNTGDSEEALSRSGWYSGNSRSKSHPVGQKTPNAWGLHDMHGNVLEWVQDWKGDYPAVNVTDPQGPSSGSNRVNRGGSWSDRAGFCRSAYRNSDDPGTTDSGLGFRLARTL